MSAPVPAAPCCHAAPCSTAGATGETPARSIGAPINGTRGA